MASRESIIFIGKKYYRYPDSDKPNQRNYFSDGRHYLHRDIWASVYGPIPKGFHVHHIDGNPLNNDISNLECIKASEHLKRHWNEERAADARLQLQRANDKAREWHRSEDGARFHSEKLAAQWRDWQPVDSVCEICGEKCEDRTMLRNKKYCSRKCAARARRMSGLDDIDRTCHQCGGTFRVNRYSKSHHCSRICGQRARRGYPSTGVQSDDSVSP